MAPLTRLASLSNKTKGLVLNMAWTLLLGVYVVAGMKGTPFHGDEAQHIHTSRDFHAVFIDPAPSNLAGGPPYEIDSDQWLRLVNGSLLRYAIGLSWYLSGFTTADLPPAPGWRWRLDYERNEEKGYLPSPGLLTAARLPSTILLVASAIVMLGIGWQFGGRGMGYFVSALYVANPVVLLNGRRAMLESSLLAFGLLTVLLAMVIVKGRTRWHWWLLLTVAAGLTLASKHSGLVFVGGAFSWIWLVAVVERLVRKKQATEDASRRFDLLGLLVVTSKLAVCACGAFIVFVLLSPALWSNPVARIGDLIAERQRVMDFQVDNDRQAPTMLHERLGGIVTQPFVEAPQYYELYFWKKSSSVGKQIRDYESSRFAGVQFGAVFGWLVTALAAFGFGVAMWRWRSWEIGLVAWWLLSASAMLINPLPWQRYYLPLIPVATVMVGIAVFVLARRLRPVVLKCWDRVRV